MNIECNVFMAYGVYTGSPSVCHAVVCYSIPEHDRRMDGQISYINIAHQRWCPDAR